MRLSEGEEREQKADGEASDQSRRGKSKGAGKESTRKGGTQNSRHPPAFERRGKGQYNSNKT